MRNMLNTFSGTSILRAATLLARPSWQEEAWTARTANKSDSISFRAQKRSGLGRNGMQTDAGDGRRDIKFNLGSSFAAASLFAVSFAFAN